MSRENQNMLFPKVKFNSIKRNLMSKKTNNTILVAGNGFDLAIGLKTKYSDFFTVVFLLLALDKYENEFKSYNFSDIRDNEICILNKVETLFPVSNQILSQTTDKNFKEKLADLKKLTEVALTWYLSLDFDIKNLKQIVQQPLFFNFVERILKDLTGLIVDKTPSYLQWRLHQDFTRSDLFIKEKSNFEGFDKFKSYENFERFIFIIDSYVKKAVYLGWMDLERFIESLVIENTYLEKKFGPPEPRVYLCNEHTIAKLYGNGLEQLCILFEKYIALINKDIPNEYDIKSLTLPYACSFSSRNSEEDSSLLDLNNVSVIFNYNYTDTFSRIWPKSTKVCHINGKVDGDFFAKRQKSKIVFGYTRNENIKTTGYSPKSLIFEKDKQRVLKNIELYDYENLIGENKYNVIIFGHSCSPADGDVLSCLLSNKNLNKAVICCYDEDTLASSYENLVQILDENPKVETTINKLIIQKKVLFCLYEKESM